MFRQAVPFVHSIFSEDVASVLQNNSLNVMLRSKQEKTNQTKNLKHDGYISSQHNALACAVKPKFYYGDVVVVPATDIASMFSQSIKIL